MKGTQTPTTRQLARALAEAWRTRRAIAMAPWANALPDAAAAYAVQDLVAAELGWFASGAAVHWKSGGASREATLTHAPLPPRNVRGTPADLGDMAFLGPAIEAEIALRLGVDITPERAHALAAGEGAELIDAMTVSIEIVDSRWSEGSRAPALLRLADLQSHGALALGDWRAFSVRDWTRQRCEVKVGDSEPRVFIGTHALADPCWVLQPWLRHLTRDGATVRAGTVVTTGTWCGLLPVSKGDLVDVTFDCVGRVGARI